MIEEVDVKRNVGTAVTDSDYGEGIGIYAYLKEDDDPDTDPSTAAGRLAPGVLANWEHSTHNTVRANVVEGNGPYAGIAAYNFDDTFPGPVAPADPDPLAPSVKRGATDSNTIGGTATGDKNTVKDNYVVPNGTTYQDDGIRVEPKVTTTISGTALVARHPLACRHARLHHEVLACLRTSPPVVPQRAGESAVAGVGGAPPSPFWCLAPWRLLGHGG